MYGPQSFPDHTKKLLVSMLDGDPAPLGLSDALAFQMMGLLNKGGEQHADGGWYYTLSDKGRKTAEAFSANLPATDISTEKSS